jgi:hypothetical protein
MFRFRCQTFGILVIFRSEKTKVQTLRGLTFKSDTKVRKIWPKGCNQVEKIMSWVKGKLRK